MEINKKAIQQLADRIEKENDLFLLSTPKEQKVIVAEDCLIRIQANQLIPYSGMFFNDSTVLRKIPQTIQSQLNTPEVGIQCEGCAKGSLFLSYIGRTNKFNPCELKEGNSIEDPQHRKLLELFTARELAYIEFAYEGAQFIEYDLLNEEITFTEEEKFKARMFYISYGGEHWGRVENDNFNPLFNDNNEHSSEENQERLIAICENIIANDGEFIL